MTLFCQYSNPYLPVVLEHQRVRRRGQRGDSAQEPLDPRHPPLQQVQQAIMNQQIRF